jgi:RNA polymerase sigma factor (sigma-70 family)
MVLTAADGGGEPDPSLHVSAADGWTGVPDTNAVGALYRVAYQAAFRLSGSRDDAQELAQESLTRLYAKRMRFTGAGHAAAWITTVATNLALDAYRRGRTARRHSMAADATSEGADELAAERVDLARALLALPRRQREVVSLRYLADTSEADTATALGISNGSVKKYASQGLAALRAQIDVIKEEPV